MRDVVDGLVLGDAGMCSGRTTIIEVMKVALRAKASERSPTHGKVTKPGQQRLDQVNDIENVQGIIDHLEEHGDDVAEFFVSGGYDLISAGLPGADVPVEVVTALGEKVAEQSWSGGSWVNVYVYDGKFFVVDEVGVGVFDRQGAALTSAGIGDRTFDAITHTWTREPTRRTNQSTQPVVVKTRSSEVRGPARPVLIVVKHWPDGTMAMKFGDAIRSALKVAGDEMKLLQMSPERIFRVKTNVSRTGFRASLREFGLDVDKVLFVEL